MTTCSARSCLTALVVAVCASASATLSCSRDCCNVDGFPILLERAPLGVAVSPVGGGLLARASSPTINAAASFPLVVDTGSPVTVFDGPPSGILVSRTFRLHDAPAATTLRATFEGINTIQLPLGPAGDAATIPLGVLGADLLRGYSVDFRLAGPCPGAVPPTPPPPVAADIAPSVCPSITFWSHQGANDGFLQDAGYAVIGFAPYGGGEVNIQGERDLFGLRAPVEVPPTRIVVRTCANPDPFEPTGPEQRCCKRGDESLPTLATGVDLALVLSTGIGPMVLSESAWARLAAKMTTTPAMMEGPLLVATWPTPIAARWTTLPRIALVNLEAGINDPGACAELGRSRRLEWVSYQQVMHPETQACAQPCDTDPRENDKAQNSAAYVEIGGQVPVAIIADTEPMIQGLRVDVRPEGPEVDGLLGVGALGPARFEVDYRNNPNRLIVTCDGEKARQLCWTGARCPRLPDREQKHLCFGLPAHQLPQTCAPSGC